MAKNAKLRLLDEIEAIASINRSLSLCRLTTPLATKWCKQHAIDSDQPDLKIRLEKYLAEGENV